MAVGRMYPNNIVPGGSRVKECLVNDNNEIIRILGMFPQSGESGRLYDGAVSYEYVGEYIDEDSGSSSGNSTEET